MGLVLKICCASVTVLNLLGLRRVIVIDFDPVAVRVLEPDLFFAIGAERDLSFFAQPVFEGDFSFVEFCDEVFDGGHREAEVVIFIFFDGLAGSADHVELCASAQAKPGMFAIVKRFRDAVEPDRFRIEARAAGQVFDVDRQVIEPWLSLSRSRIGIAAKRHDGECEYQ